EAVQDTIETAAKDRGYDSMRIMSGAGHDAQEMAAIAPAAMVFVRGQHQGISHNPREYSTPEDCAAGIEVLASAVKALSAWGLRTRIAASGPIVRRGPSDGVRRGPSGGTPPQAGSGFTRRGPSSSAASAPQPGRGRRSARRR